MNRFFILALIAALSGSSALYAQDIITLKNGEKLRATDIRINLTDVFFKMYDYPQGETWRIDKENISTIVYENGLQTIFNEQQAQPQLYGNQQQNRNGNQQQERNQQQYESQQQYGYQQQYRNQQQYGYQQHYRSQPDNYWKFNIGISFPGGDWSDGVGTGFGVGIKSYSSLGTTAPNLYLVYGAELYYHGVSSDIKDAYDDDYYGTDVTYPMYFNLPVTIGGNYTVPLPNTNTCIYGEAAIGLNASYITKMVINERNNKWNISYDPAFGFCYGFEAGIVLNELVNIGIRYNKLGTYNYTMKSYDMKEKTGKIELSNTVLVLGIRF